MTDLPRLQALGRPTDTAPSASRFLKTMDGTAGAYGHGEWFLPVGKRPGKWMPKVKPVLCESGYHVCRDLSEVLTHAGPELYEVEVRGTCVEGEDKAAWEQARLVWRVAEWNPTTCYLFNIDCARRIQELAHPDDAEMLRAVLDIFTAEAEFGDDWENAAKSAARAAWDARDARAARAAWAARDAWAARAARYAERTWQLGILARYLAGEQGPFVEASGD